MIIQQQSCIKKVTQELKQIRPIFNELLDKLESGDMLVVTKLDRFARSLSQGNDLVTELINKGIRVNP